MTDQINWVHRCMVIRQEDALLARYLAGTFGPSSQGMFTTPLCPLAGTESPTHYISVGLIDKPFADMLSSPEALVAGAAYLGIPVELDIAIRLLAGADISQDAGDVAMARLGLKLWDNGEMSELIDADGMPLTDSDSMLEN